MEDSEEITIVNEVEVEEVEENDMNIATESTMDEFPAPSESTRTTRRVNQISRKV